MDKKAQMGMKKPVSFLLGFAFIALGLIPILKTMNVISFDIPLLPEVVIQVLMIVGGIWLLIDAISLMSGGSFGAGQTFMFGSYIVGLAVLALGMVPLLHGMGVIGFTVTLTSIGPLVLNIIYIVIGSLCILDGSQIMF